MDDSSSLALDVISVPFSDLTEGVSAPSERLAPAKTAGSLTERALALDGRLTVEKAVTPLTDGA
ncbi:hypothetical protein SNEBB_005526, partial [Seison nebaliae]